MDCGLTFEPECRGGPGQDALGRHLPEHLAAEEIVGEREIDPRDVVVELRAALAVEQKQAGALCVDRRAGDLDAPHRQGAVGQARVDVRRVELHAARSGRCQHRRRVDVVIGEQR